MTEFAYRLKSLGTETAFAVSQDAAEFAAQGNKVYPFHLGDLDLPTPPNIMEAAVKAMRDGKTGYNPAAGIPQLRDSLAEVVGAERGLLAQKCCSRNSKKENHSRRAAAYAADIHIILEDLTILLMKK